jgi:hypothetical protein
MGDEAPEGIPASEVGRLNRFLMLLVLAGTLATILGMSYTVAQYEEVLIRLRQVKLPISKMPLLLTDYHLLVVFPMLAIAGKCAWETFRRRSCRRTIYVNVVGIVVLLGCWALHSTVFYASDAALIQRSVPRDP